MAKGSNMGLRARALCKIAELSAKTTRQRDGEPGLDKLYSALSILKSDTSDPSIITVTSPTGRPLSRTPMTSDELNVLLALCAATPLVENDEDATRLFHQLCPYLLESQEQTLASSPYILSIEPSPWEALTKGLTTAIMNLGMKHLFLASSAVEQVFRYVNNCAKAIASRKAQQNGDHKKPHQRAPTDVIILLMSMLGFLEAMAASVDLLSSLQCLELLHKLHNLVAGNFTVAIEGALSSLRIIEPGRRPVKEHYVMIERYAKCGQPLGAMLLQRAFMKLVVSCASLQIASTETLQQHSVLDYLMPLKNPIKETTGAQNKVLAMALTKIAAEIMQTIEDGADYLELAASSQQYLAFKVRGHALTTLLTCIVADEEVADPDVLMTWLDNAMSDPNQMADADLASVVFKCLAVLARTSPAFATSLSRLIPRFIVRNGNQLQSKETAAKCFASILKSLSQDAIITSLYSLGNVLSSSAADPALQTNGISGTKMNPKYTNHSTASAISFAAVGDEETLGVYSNTIKAIVIVATQSDDKKIVPLAQSMLLQKLTRVNATVDALIITETASLGLISEQSDLRSLLKLYDRISHDAVMNQKDILLDAVSKAHVRLATNLPRTSPLFSVYFTYLLETIVGKGEVSEKRERHDQQRVDVERAAEEISLLLLPLSILAPYFEEFLVSMDDESIASLQREVWFNIAVHGILPETRLWQKHLLELKSLAKYTRPLVAEDRTDHLESDIELNTVLRRGMNGPHIAEMKKSLIRLLPEQEPKIRSLAYEKVIFLHAAYCVETLRAKDGACSQVLSYFIDPSVNQEGTRECMTAIVSHSVDLFLTHCERKLLTGSTAPVLATELAKILQMSCHRVAACQSAAISVADRLITALPSALCQKSSLFALLELLTLMWSSCLESEIDEYEWKSSYFSAISNIQLELSDDYEYRKKTLKTLQKQAKNWVERVINIAPLDVKGLLQTYLSDFSDDGAYGHMALGRTFALDMGSVIPSSDQRLESVANYDESRIDTASDFVAQYTTRQEYKYAEAIPALDREWYDSHNHDFGSNMDLVKPNRLGKDARAILRILDRQASGGCYASFSAMRDLLRRAAAIVCRSEEDQSAIIHYLVAIPFSLLSKQALNLGISLWLGVINENPSMESRVLVEVFKCWEESVHKKKGIFSDQSEHLDPFFVKEEYAPSDPVLLAQRQQVTTNMIVPHLRILQFLSSHLEAYRLGSPSLRRSYQRMAHLTLGGLKKSTCHPLAREFHFKTILFALTVLNHGEDLSYSLRWRLKDHILSAALAWFSYAPRFSFGGNRIQIKAECKVILEVETSLKQVKLVGETLNNALPSLNAKTDLLLRLMDHELSRLQVWLYPSGLDPKRNISHRRSDNSTLASVSPQLLQIAWTENPSLAIQLVTRAQNPGVAKGVRWLLLKCSDEAINEPEALHVLFSDGLPKDVSAQLKYLLYWKAINPISAVTYFLPNYRNHPFIIQYAMRALESHSVDITFFYVPQIVQTLRYDQLGYVQRYIIETGKVSQLFAHQIIWNMKANAYKDEDSTIEDELKPTLEIVMYNMIGSFSLSDKAFYEKEFTFFNEVTGISGKLRPYIKKEKSEKKQKIEEELRKIKVEVGVYLPSNPEGVVIGIDRKSGKPLQSHAKAPYMATFRIRKNKADWESSGQHKENTISKTKLIRSSQNLHESTYDVWQSAIFKVGDDCRQDVLALQMISAFRNIFNNVGLDVWVFPYRVTATAPGCGVIDVLPNSISRDMLGREAVNGLHDYFISKYGGEDSIKFQKARNNFVKSMAAYSLISYLLQFKDRHNGNIMVNDTGHIIHIDFGFCFDIAPGGVKFERAPFKLTAEMVAVMGGSTNSQSYKWFEDLCVKAFLVSRPYAEKLSHLVVLMLDSGLPCFKPETIQHFKERFVLTKTEREAADFMRELIRKSYSSYSTKGYDHFQLLTNGIPY